MKNFAKLALSLLALPTLLLASSSASAEKLPAECANFNIDKWASEGLQCKVEVKGGCEANCNSLKLTAGCDGQCTTTATMTCTGSCGETCLQQCNPESLNCMNSCHNECDQDYIKACESSHPGRDCVNDAKASCESHCRDKCNVPLQSTCEDHCIACCNGACTSNVNMDCDISCYAKLEGGCKVQCEAPSGALFCNNQFISITDVDACISALAARGVEVDVSARGECVCTLSGCDCTGDANAGGGFCSAAPGRESPFGSTIVVLGMAAAGISVARRRNRKNG
jgi:hypothetical protein